MQRVLAFSNFLYQGKEVKRYIKLTIYKRMLVQKLCETWGCFFPTISLLELAVTSSGRCISNIYPNWNIQETFTINYQQSWHLNLNQNYFENTTDCLLNAGDWGEAGKQMGFLWTFSQAPWGTALSLGFTFISSLYLIALPNVVPNYIFPDKDILPVLFHIDWPWLAQPILTPHCSECEVALGKYLQHEWVWKDLSFLIGK